MVVIDEAHHTAGPVGRQWSAIHHDDEVPAARRLYLTATPRMLVGEGVTTMDDEATYGPVAYRLSFAQAIEDEVLADYRLVVIVISHAEVRALVESGGLLQVGPDQVPASVVAGQVAVLRACRQYGATRVLTFHTTVRAAGTFARSLGAANALLPLDERIRNLVTRQVHGGMNATQRQEAIDQLSQPGPHTVIVSNVAVFSEAVDVPAVDAVAFLSGRDSPEATIQAVGRALRRDGRHDKIATVVIPIVLDLDQDPETALDTSDFAPAFRTIRALRAHDERLAKRLDAIRARLGEDAQRARQARDGRDCERPSDRTDREQPSEQQLDMEWLGVIGMPLPAEFVHAIRVRLVTETTPDWEEKFGLASAYRACTGHLNPTQNDDPTLDNWLIQQRKERRSGRLPLEYQDRLTALGMVWEPYEVAWEDNFQVVAEHVAATGKWDITARMTCGDPPRQSGNWIGQQRKKWKLLSPERRERLLAIGFDPDPYETAWRTGYRCAAEFRAEWGHLIVPRDEIYGPDNFRLGQWLGMQITAYRAEGLDAERQRLLDELGMIWFPKPVQYAGKPEELQQAWHSDLDNIIETLTSARLRLGWPTARLVRALQVKGPEFAEWESREADPPLSLLHGWADATDHRLSLIDLDSGQELPPGKPTTSHPNVDEQSVATAALVSALYIRRRGWRVRQRAAAIAAGMSQAQLAKRELGNVPTQLTELLPWGRVLGARLRAVPKTPHENAAPGPDSSGAT